MKKFRINKIQHHQTILPEILQLIPSPNRLRLLYSSSRASRFYLCLYLPFLSKNENCLLAFEGYTITTLVSSHHFEILIEIDIPSEEGYASCRSAGRPGSFLFMKRISWYFKNGLVQLIRDAEKGLVLKEPGIETVAQYGKEKIAVGQNYFYELQRYIGTMHLNIKELDTFEVKVSIELGVGIYSMK